MINFRRKIGIILVVAVSAAAVLAIPASASAAPRKGDSTAPAPFEYGCQGTVIVNNSNWSYKPPESFYSCTSSFTLSTQRSVLLELQPHSNFTGNMQAELRSSNGVLVTISGDYVAGVQIRQEVATPTLTAGTWTMTARAKVFAGSIDWMVRQGVYVPLSTGGYGGRITSL